MRSCPSATIGLSVWLGRSTCGADLPAPHVSQPYIHYYSPLFEIEPCKAQYSEGE